MPCLLDVQLPDGNDHLVRQDLDNVRARAARAGPSQSLRLRLSGTVRAHWPRGAHPPLFLSSAAEHARTGKKYDSAQLRRLRNARLCSSASGHANVLRCAFVCGKRSSPAAVGWKMGRSAGKNHHRFWRLPRPVRRFAPDQLETPMHSRPPHRMILPGRCGSACGGRCSPERRG